VALWICGYPRGYLTLAISNIAELISSYPPVIHRPRGVIHSYPLLSTNLSTNLSTWPGGRIFLFPRGKLTPRYPPCGAGKGLTHKGLQGIIAPRNQRSLSWLVACPSDSPACSNRYRTGKCYPVSQSASQPRPALPPSTEQPHSKEAAALLTWASVILSKQTSSKI
jgi:hypothetical protein